jgi:hypothetical protein
VETEAIGSGAGAPDTATEATAQLAAKLAATEGELVKARVAREIDVALLTAGVTDLEAGRVLVEKQVEALGAKDPGAEDGALVKQAVAAVRKKQAYLFGGRSGSMPTGATGAIRRRDLGESAADGAAKRALATGDRKAVLEYLRLKRGV